MKLFYQAFWKSSIELLPRVISQKSSPESLNAFFNSSKEDWLIKESDAFDMSSITSKKQNAGDMGKKPLLEDDEDKEIVEE